MEDMKNGLKSYMEGLKEGLTKLLEEMIPHGENLVEETHEKRKININHDFINYNVGLKTHYIPNIDMRKFDGKDPITWIQQIEQVPVQTILPELDEEGKIILEPEEVT